VIQGVFGCQENGVNMPSLMPGMPGTKESYGISIIRKDLSVNIPPKAFKRYELNAGDLVLLTTTHRGEGGFAILNKNKAEVTVFKKYISQIEESETVYWFKEKAYALTTTGDSVIYLTPNMLDAFHLKSESRLMVVKSTTVAMSFTPVEIWKEKFSNRGLNEAVDNMSKLEVF
jgi:hypothetical protein